MSYTSYNTCEDGLRMDIKKLGAFDHVYAVEGFADEFKHLFDPREYKRYSDWLNRSLTMVEEGHPLRMPLFEKLGGCEGLYSIRNPNSKKNPRVLFMYYLGHTSDGKARIILLTAFMEKSKSDYNKAIERAKRIRMELLKEE